MAQFLAALAAPARELVPKDSNCHQLTLDSHQPDKDSHQSLAFPSPLIGIKHVPPLSR